MTYFCGPTRVGPLSTNVKLQQRQIQSVSRHIFVVQLEWVLSLLNQCQAATDINFVHANQFGLTKNKPD